MIVFAFSNNADLSVTHTNEQQTSYMISHKKVHVNTTIVLHSIVKDTNIKFVCSLFVDANIANFQNGKKADNSLELKQNIQE